MKGAMFWFVLLIVLGLTGIAYGWIVVRWDSERITVSFERAKVIPALRRVKERAVSFVERHRHFEDRNSSH